MRAMKKRFVPRKSPVQARSRLTVKAILEAAAQVLVAQGYARTTTDAIAARAGVSIGTLYQYFPNSEAIVAALIKSHVDELIKLLDEALARHRDDSPEDVLRGIIRAGIQAHQIDPPLHKVLFEQVHKDDISPDAVDVSSRLQVMIESFLRKKYPRLSKSRVRMAALVIETCTEALTHRAVVEAPEWLRSGELEKEAIALLGPYLSKLTEAV